MTTEILKAEKFTEEDKSRADILKGAVGAVASQIKDAHLTAVRGFARLGNLLFEVRAKKYWLMWGAPSFGQYIKDLEDSTGLGRTQTYQAISVAEVLLPVTSEESIEKMGISKASELKKYMADTGRKPTKALIAKAEDENVTIAELRADLFKAQNGDGQDKGKYRDLKGFFATDEEWAEIQRAFSIAEKIDPVIPKETPQPVRLKEVLMRLCGEFISTYAAEVEGANK